MASLPTPASGVAPAAAPRARSADLRIGGSLLFLAGSMILMGIITAEAAYPGAYSTGADAISDLGGTEPPNSVILQPSATIFDATMVIGGLLVIVGSWLVHRAFGLWSITIPTVTLGAAALGVGLFPGNTGTPHAIFAMVTFVSGGVAAVSAARVMGAPIRYLSIVLGGVALLTLGSYIALGSSSPVAVLGLGGLERWIAYPIVLWVTGFGAYVAGRGHPGQVQAARRDGGRRQAE